MRNRRFGGTWLLAFLLLSFPCVMQAQEKSVQPGINKTFRGSRSSTSAQWTERFEKEGREIYDHRGTDCLAACELRPGLEVADVGAGSGSVHAVCSPRRSEQRRAGVYAVDIAEKFLHENRPSLAPRDAGTDERHERVMLQCRRRQNCPRPPWTWCFICDTYHHFPLSLEDDGFVLPPSAFCGPGGRLVIVDFKRVAGGEFGMDLRTCPGESRGRHRGQLQACGF